MHITNSDYTSSLHSNSTHPCISPPCSLTFMHTSHSTHPLHSPTPPTHSTHPDHPHTYLLVGLFHNVSCLPLVLLFESLRESISLRQVTLALLLCPAGTMPAYEQSSYSNGNLSKLSLPVFTISWFQPEFKISSLASVLISVFNLYSK